MLESIWDEELWFPENSTGPRYSWKDLENQPGSDVYHPQVHDLHWSFIIGIMLLAIRYLNKKLLIEPLGYYLGVSRRKLRPLTGNTVLEKAYQQNKTIGPDLIKNLSKQTDMSSRKIEVWFRIRRQKDTPSPMKKFEECCWHFIFYSTAALYGFYVLWDEPWFWSTKECWMTWPGSHVSNEVYWYYTVEMSFYWCLILSLMKDHKRKDFTEFVIHHIATIILLYFSWFMNFTRAGTLVLIAHDVSDPWLLFAKMCKYTKHKQLTEVAFVIFILTWVASRLFYYPFIVLYCTTVEPFYRIEKTFFAHIFLNFFLYLLMVLHLMWSYSIARIVIKKLRQGELEDVRSDSDSDDEVESDTSCDINENGAYKSTLTQRSNGHVGIEQRI